MPTLQPWRVTINAKPEDVWPYVGNLEKQADWSPKPYSVEWLSGEPNRVGSRFRSTGWLPQDKNHRMEGEVTISEGPNRFEVKTSDASGEFTNTYVLTARSDGTTLVEKTLVVPPPKGVQKVIGPIIFPLFVRGAIQKGMNRLKTVVESSGKA